MFSIQKNFLIVFPIWLSADLPAPLADIDAELVSRPTPSLSVDADIVAATLTSFDETPTAVHPTRIKAIMPSCPAIAAMKTMM